MIHRPSDMGGFQFAVLATLRASQLMRGCLPRVGGNHKATIIAQYEVAEGKVIQAARVPVSVADSGQVATETPTVVQPA
jgi:hypothetical protein